MKRNYMRMIIKEMATTNIEKEKEIDSNNQCKQIKNTHDKINL